MERWILYFTSFSFKSDNSNPDISVRLYDTRRGRRRRCARGTGRRDASATKAPADPAFPAVVAAAASAAASETSRRRRHEEPLRPPHPKFKPIFCTGVVSEIQNSNKFGFFGLSAFWNEQLRFFKILKYTGRYGFPEILIEVRAAFFRDGAR